jgi:hypothetical protein
MQNDIPVKDFSQEEIAFASQAELDKYNNSLVDTTVRLLGDKTVVAEIVQLIAYIRHAVKNNMTKDIIVGVKNTVANVPFTFTVNDTTIPDLVTVDYTQIN